MTKPLKGRLPVKKDPRSLKLSSYLKQEQVNLPKQWNCEEQYRWELPQTGAIGDFEIGSWGGHAMYISGYNENGLKAITWGKEKWMSWEYWDTYCDEAYAVLSNSFIKGKKSRRH